MLSKLRSISGFFSSAVKIHDSAHGKCHKCKKVLKWIEVMVSTQVDSLPPLFPALSSPALINFPGPVGTAAL